ncbi:cytochrome P450 4V2-like [Vanessa atalanta]|uniref:cytochrome P450 4V2-like n=1 Tax=Vanessa atalanta TaxID=42275 RepID=UPI001FCDD1B5|nr:cytochrome P450 4V2-like [Vanessa atalanta]
MEMFEVLKLSATVSLPILLYWIYWRWRHRRMLELAALVPGPPALPILGNALMFMAHPEEQLLKIEELLNNYGQYVKFWLGSDLNICVKNPADIKYLLTSNKVNQKGPLYDFMTTFIGRGILTGGPTWRLYRKIATPSYNKKSVKVFSEIFNQEAACLSKVLSNKDPEMTFDVYYDVVVCTTQCVCQTLMGLSKEESENIKNLDEVIAKTQSMYSLIFSKMTHWWLQIPLIYWLTGNKTKEKYFVKIVDEMTSDILQKRRSALQRETDTDDALGVVDRFILNGLPDEEIKLETFSLFTTSQEASAKIASAVLLFLAYLPEWQGKVHKEIIEVVGPHDEHITEEQLKKLNNLDMVYKEVLRYMSIGAMIQRTVEEEITINDGKITLPAGTSLVIPIHELHRDARYWDEPYKVKPERFLPENIKNRDPNAFIPFSLGAMDCLGRIYATTLIKTLIVKVIRRVQLEADGRLEDLELHIAISVKFANGYNLRARKRRPINGITLQHG